MAAEKDIKEFEEAIDFVRKVEMHCNEKVSKAFLMTLRAYRNGRKDLVDAYRDSLYGDFFAGEDERDAGKPTKICPF
ncbi:hypothetical protein D5086_021378 [Populus alba]|uniref:Uncharacterized protein n=1 Tax=Populus alba TaxID=43335 RepID=A0ACC4BC02_POPAL